MNGIKHFENLIFDLLFLWKYPGYVQWKMNTWFTQTSCSLYLISIFFIEHPDWMTDLKHTDSTW
jgi:hypothetical protein